MAIAVTLAVAGCAPGSDDSSELPGARKPAARTPPPSEPPPVERWKAGPAEEQADAKEFAARVAQTALRYPRGSNTAKVAARLVKLGGGTADLSGLLEGVVRPKWRSWARVVYPQLSGLGVDTVGTMVMVDQTVESPNGARSTHRRVLDIRLRRVEGGYSLDQLGSLGGDPRARPPDLSAVERQAVSDPRIEVSDSARWDIYEGKVDQGLLEAVVALAKRHDIAVGPIISGHPINVWETDRVSAHSQGLAADIYAIDGRLVAEQEGPDTPASQVTAELLAGGAVQVGSPQAIAGVGARSFSDGVHQDHVHLQQSPATSP